MRVTIRDLLSVVAIVSLLAGWRVSHVKADVLGQLAESRQQQLASAKERESELVATVDRLTARMDELREPACSYAPFAANANQAATIAPMRFRLRTLLITMLLGPAAIALLPRWFSGSPGIFWTAYFAFGWTLIVFGLWCVGR
jgi:hypothetical protein